MGLVLQNGQALMPVVVTGAEIEMFRSVQKYCHLTCGTWTAAGPDRGLGGVNAETGFGMKFCI